MNRNSYLRNLEDAFEMKSDASSISQERHLSVSEQEVIYRIQKGDNLSYAISVHRVKTSLSAQEIMFNYNLFVKQNEFMRTVYRYNGQAVPSKIVFTTEGEFFPIKDISDEEELSQIQIIRNVVAASVRKKANIEKNKMVLLQAFKVGRDDFIVIVARYTWLMPEKLSGITLCYKIFGGKSTVSGTDDSLSASSAMSYNKNLHNEHIKYWKEYFEKYRAYLGSAEKKYQDRIAGYQSKIRILSTDIVNAVRKFSDENNVSQRTVMITAGACTYAQKVKKNNLVMLVSILGEGLHAAPVFFDAGLSFADACKSIDNQISEHEDHSFIRQDELEKIYGGDFTKYFWIYQSSYDYSAVDDVFSGGKSTEITLGETHKNLLIELKYRMEDSSPSVEYFLGKSLPENTIDIMHRELEMKLEKLLSVTSKEVSQSQDTPVIEEKDTSGSNLIEIEKMVEKGDKEAQKEMDIQVAIYLKLSGLFDGMSKEKLVKFAEKCSLNTYVQDDIVLSSGELTNSFYIIGKGSIEESLVDNDGYVKTVGMHSDKSCFGACCLSSNSISNTAWTVFSNEASVVEIPVAELVGCFDSNPQSYRKLIEQQEKNISKYRKLWTME